MKMSVAGFKTGFPIQKAKLAPIEAFLFRRLAAIGAAQQEHIMPGIDAIPPQKVLRNVAFPSTRCSHCDGNKVWIKEPSRIPSTAAFQIDLK
jgi:hypothetical protein